MKSIHTAATKLELLSTTVHKVLRCKRLQLYAYKVQMLEKLQPNDKPKRKEFAESTLQQISEDKELLTASNTDPVSINFYAIVELKNLMVVFFHSSSCTFAESERPILFQ